MTTSIRTIATACWAITVVCTSGCGKTESPPASASASAPTVVAAPTVAAAAAVGLAAKLCGILRQKAPDLKGMSEVGARTQLVMAIGTGFDADAKALGVVSSDIDAIAASSCPEVRGPLLAATKTTSLQEAVR